MMVVEKCSTQPKIKFDVRIQSLIMSEISWHFVLLTAKLTSAGHAAIECRIQSSAGRFSPPANTWRGSHLFHIGDSHNLTWNNCYKQKSQQLCTTGISDGFPQCPKRKCHSCFVHPQHTQVSHYIKHEVEMLCPVFYGCLFLCVRLRPLCFSCQDNI